MCQQGEGEIAYYNLRNREKPMSDVMEAEPMPAFAKPTQNYRKVMRPDGSIAYYRCWIVDDTLDWREVLVVDGEIVG